MRTHQAIVQTAGHALIAEKLGRPITTVRSWDRRNSIPVAEWDAVIAQEWASLEELHAARVAHEAEKSEQVS